MSGLLDHLSIPVVNLERAATFYDAVLATLGMLRTRDAPGAVAYGPPDRRAPVFWLLHSTSGRSAQSGLGLHLAFEADDHATVDAFYETALRSGGRPAGDPGPRPQYTQPFYGAFVLDLDGLKVEAVCRREG